MNNKIAATDQDFEQAFFQLAYDKLQAKLFNLLPFLVGFEVVKKSDDNTKAIGVFGFKSENGQILYVPAFFINGKVKDLDVLYSRNNNQFYPLNEDFAELFLKDDVTGVGVPSEGKRQDVLKEVPTKNYYDTIRPPRTGRTIYASAPEYRKGTFAEAQIPVPSFEVFITEKTKHASTSLTDFLSAMDNNVKAAFWGQLKDSPDYMDAVLHFYDKADLAKALVPKQAEEPAPLVEVLTLEDASRLSKEAEEIKEQVLKEGFAIVDHRTPDGKSKVGLFKYVERFTNPTVSGFYPYVTCCGSVRHGLVLVRPEHLYNGYAAPEAIVVDLDSPKPGQAYKAKANHIFIKDQIKIKEFGSLIQKLEDPAEAKPGFGNTYILINENLAASVPFRVSENFKDDDGIRRIKVEPVEGFEKTSCCEPCGTTESRNHMREVILVLTKKKGDKFHHAGKNMVYVPKGFKLMKLDFSTYYDTYVSWDVPEGKREKEQKKKKEEAARIKNGRPGPASILFGTLAENSIFPMTVHRNGSQYFANVSHVRKAYNSPGEAKVGMVKDFGLSVKAATELAETINDKQYIRGYIKLAVTGEEILPLVDEAPYTNELGQPQYVGTPWEAMGSRSDGYTGNPAQLGLGVMPEVTGQEATTPQKPPQQNTQDATQLAQSGQKEIFDTQAISTLARYVDPANKVVSYVPTFVSTLDKLGRILFMIYWDTDKFQEMYGKDELPELIELVKNVYKNLGDLIIFLKRKVPDISINNSEQAMDQV